MSAEMIGKVWYLERSLLEMFPCEDAEPWDNPGLLVGDAEENITGIAVALDVSLANIRAAHEAGCNVLFTHHPAFLKPPGSIVANGPSTWKHHGIRGDSIEQANAGVVTYEAIRLGVALIAMHTNFDASACAQRVLPDMLGLMYLNPMDQTANAGQALGAGEVKGGLGQLCSTEPLKLRDLALRCHDVFHATPRVWGDPERRIQFIVTVPGSAWPVINDATRCDFDCCICGETRYHTALAAVASGNSIIELGHDVSEYPFMDRFCDILSGLGYPQRMIHKLEPTTNWWTV